MKKSNKCCREEHCHSDAEGFSQVTQTPSSQAQQTATGALGWVDVGESIFISDCLPVWAYYCFCVASLSTIFTILSVLILFVLD